MFMRPRVFEAGYLAGDGGMVCHHLAREVLDRRGLRLFFGKAARPDLILVGLGGDGEKFPVLDAEPLPRRR